MPLPIEKNEPYTFEDCLAGDEEELLEIIDGEPIMMAPPSSNHQRISGALFAQFYNYLEGKKCEVFSAPFGVRPFEKDGDKPEDVTTLLQPDISVVCDKSKIDKRGCKGAPDMVIEILSPSTRRHDQLVKLNLYQKAGVREYWIVSPEEETVKVFLLENGILTLHELYEKKDFARVNILANCGIDLSRVFPE